MGAAKDMWMQDIERVCDDFAAEEITHDQALNSLHRLGIDDDEAEEMLAAAVA